MAAEWGRVYRTEAVALDCLGPFIFKEELLKFLWYHFTHLLNVSNIGSVFPNSKTPASTSLKMHQLSACWAQQLCSKTVPTTNAGFYLLQCLTVAAFVMWNIPRASKQLKTTTMEAYHTAIEDLTSVCANVSKRTMFQRIITIELDARAAPVQ